MPGFIAHAQAIAETGMAFVDAATAAGMRYPFPLAIDIDATPDGPALLVQGLPALEGVQRFCRRAPQAAPLSAHAHLALTAAAGAFAKALSALEQDARALPGWVGGDALGLHTKLLFGAPAGSTEAHKAPGTAGVHGLVTLETASLCPVMGRKATEISEPFRATCLQLGKMLDHAAERTRRWDPGALDVWHVRDARYAVSQPGPVREVFAPSEEAALEADTWWHFHPSLYAVPTRHLPERRATRIRAHALVG